MPALPLRIPDYPVMDDNRLYNFCVYNPELKIERTSKGELLIIAPSGGETGNRNSMITYFVKSYEIRKGGGVSFDSSTGFLLPNKAIRSPDAAWIRLEKWNSLTSEEKRRFVPICPDFLIELLSESDELGQTQLKMNEWMENGCSLAWLIDPFQKKTIVYRKGKSPERN
ncbi:MAG TPA: Uma2 family endonuclease [Leptospiraceae bacterium]|nr:Uma2 family endonuclease [Leptospiraceae bacterium]